jgi:hypothetical protein
MNLVLRNASLSAALPNALSVNAFWNQLQNIRRNQVVVKNDICRLEQSQSLNGQKGRITWPGSY